MDSPPIPSSQSASASAASPPPPAEVEVKREEREKEMVHRTKVIQFLGRTTPIILQNDNGPCPLLAICNVLSLKNSLNLSPDTSEVSQEKLLSLVAERLIDTNINIDNKEAGYVENQQQNIADAIDLLPRLTTGIDVNIKFRRIDDFEFTPECAIFDLLDIPLYHGWIVDPQDHETADAISSKSYNTLMGELVSLETQIMESEQKNNPEEDSVDFVAATTAALGVPSPCLSREAEGSNSIADGVVGAVNLHESAYVKDSEPITLLETAEKNFSDETVKAGTPISDDSNALNNHHVDLKSPEVFLQGAISKTDQDKSCMRPTYEESRELGDTVVSSDVGTENGKVQSVSSGIDPPSASDRPRDKSSDEHAQSEITTISDPDETRNHQTDCQARDSPSLLKAAADSNSSAGQMHHIDEPEAFSSSVDDSEPIYEGEECILESGTIAYESREPVYEGEVVLAEQVDNRGCMDVGAPNSKERISIKQGEIIRNFLRNSASQLTIYGLFCLQDKVKERELCVFFRNNHFNTMFKYEGELYILATDQGYINQPDLVWEKLNEVNGDTVYMTGNFKEFKMEDHSSSTWDEQNVMASTADYLASIDSTQANASLNSDLQLAIALQQQEFEQQQQQQEQQSQRILQQPAVSGGSRLVTGPQ
ncbi:UNVERIFIED_CONTAM: Ubiquitin carboxyl-terminal hydrolase MINDY-1, partial [Sesamum radiatum]